MYVTCKVNRAAQGLFYSGIIHNDNDKYTFVYDCGTDSPGCAGNMSVLCESICEFKSQIDKKIDLLIISHFHYDHISGIQELLEGIKVDTVVMPYTSDIERLLYIASFDKDLTDNERTLMENPASYFAQCGVNLVIIVGTPEDNNDDSIPQKENPSQTPQSDIIYSPHDEGGKWEPLIDASSNRNRGNCYFYSKDIAIHCRLGWEFLIYSDPSAVSSLESLHTDIKNLTNGDIRRYLKSCNKDMLKKIKLLYDGHLVKRSLNQQSVLVISRPKYPCLYDYVNVIWDYRSVYPLRSSTCTSVLLGDIPIRHSPNAIQFLRDNLSNGEIFAVLLPHHGSRDGIHKCVMPFFSDTLIYIASYGKKRVKTRNHPHMAHLIKTVDSMFCFVPVNDLNDFQYTVCFSHLNV